MIGQEIQRKRKALGMTQREVADKVGVCWTTISNLERDANVKHSLLLEVCKMLGLELRVVDVLPAEEKEKPKKNNRVKLID